jgi:hypothetical protein
VEARPAQPHTQRARRSLQCAGGSRRRSTSAHPGLSVELITGFDKHREAWGMVDLKQAVSCALVTSEDGGANQIPHPTSHANKGHLAIDCAG